MIKRGVFVHFSSSVGFRGRKMETQMEDKVHRAFRSRGETWVWDAEIGFVRVLTMKHREAGAKG